MDTMTSHERLLTALSCREPDRVPWLESVVETDAALALLGCTDSTQDTPAIPGAQGLPVSIGMRPPSGPGYEALDVVRALGLDAIGIHLYLPHAGLRQEIEGRYMAVGGRLQTRADLAALHLPDPDDPALYEPYRLFVERYRDTGLALFCRLSLGSDPVVLGMGFERFALALYDDRDLVVDLLDLYTGWYARATRHLCALGFDFLWFGDDIAFKTAPYMSPRLFRELFMPRFRSVANEIRKPWVFHSDGNLMPILDDLLDLGLNGLHPIEPGAMDLGELKRRYHGRLCLCGHISLDALCRGTPQQVAELTRQAIAVAAPGGGYIAGSSNSIINQCRPENVRAMQTAIAHYGRYPIS